MVIVSTGNTAIRTPAVNIPETADPGVMSAPVPLRVLGLPST
jgi:hypothetical protein